MDEFPVLQCDCLKLASRNFASHSRWKSRRNPPGCLAWKNCGLRFHRNFSVETCQKHPKTSAISSGPVPTSKTSLLAWPKSALNFFCDDMSNVYFGVRKQVWMCYLCAATGSRTKLTESGASCNWQPPTVHGLGQLASSQLWPCTFAVHQRQTPLCTVLGSKCVADMLTTWQNSYCSWGKHTWSPREKLLGPSWLQGFANSHQQRVQTTWGSELQCPSHLQDLLLPGEWLDFQLRPPSNGKLPIPSIPRNRYQSSTQRCHTIDFPPVPPCSIWRGSELHTHQRPWASNPLGCWNWSNPSTSAVSGCLPHIPGPWTSQPCSLGHWHVPSATRWSLRNDAGIPQPCSGAENWCMRSQCLWSCPHPWANRSNHSSQNRFYPGDAENFRRSKSWANLWEPQ